MSRLALAAAAAALALTAWPAQAIDPGVASAHFVGDGVKVSPTHAVALLVENAEGQLDRPNEMRVLLTEEEAPASALEGLIFTPAEAMGRAGALHGLLITFDPADRSAVSVRVLAKPEPGRTMASLSISNTEGVWTRLESGPTRVVGELRRGDTLDLAAVFSAPVFTNPVRQDMRGAAAQASAPVKALLARFEAIGKGDLAAAQALSTKDAAAQLAAAWPEARKQAAQMVPELLKQIRSTRRVVVREHTAAVEGTDGSWFSLALEDGVWKAAD